MYRQQQAIQLSNQLSHVQAMSRQLHQAETNRQQTEQQLITQAAQCRQFAQQVEQAVTNCIQTANQIAQAPIQPDPSFSTQYGNNQPQWQQTNPSNPVS